MFERQSLVCTVDHHGVVIWQKPTAEYVVAIVWCFDSGHLALAEKGVTQLPGDWAPSIGDLVVARCREEGGFRRCHHLELVEPAYDTTLTERLLDYSRLGRPTRSRARSR